MFNDLNNKKSDISVFYKTINNLKLPLQVFLPDNFNKNNKYKTIIAIHGGGWNSFKETPVNWDGGWMANNVKYYARKGYVGIVFSYRDLKFSMNGDVGDLLKDCYDAIKYIKDEFSFVDSEDILLMGDSAGGHLALSMGLRLPNDENIALNPSKIVAYNPVTDCVCDKWSYCADAPIKYSPIHNIKKTDTEILVMHGTADVIVDIEDSRIFVAEMKKVGNNISLIEIPEARHAFILFGYTSKEEDVVEALELTDGYFDL